MIANVTVPDWLLKPSGVWLQDIIPCASMVFCVPTLKIYYDKKKYGNLVVFSIGFLLAVIYHAVHMNVEGIHKTEFLGISGTTWRTLDIAMCQILLARTLGNALGDKHPCVAVIPNVIFPTILAYFFFTMESVKMSLITQLNGLIMLATVVVKLLVDGHRRFPTYTWHSTIRLLVSFALGFASFKLPERQPHLYWFWHSMWHLFMGLGYYELYTQLEKSHPSIEMKDKEKVF